MHSNPTLQQFRDDIRLLPFHVLFDIWWVELRSKILIISLGSNPTVHLPHGWPDTIRSCEGWCKVKPASKCVIGGQDKASALVPRMVICRPAPSPMSGHPMKGAAVGCIQHRWLTVHLGHSHELTQATCARNGNRFVVQKQILHRTFSISANFFKN
ncbi:hypothetical protein BJ165DRAFT_930921 [Panaeolus papilionaceus]|nr:hypothetical protein BJ165DRAFT_930921 [Panaeolus papilionaceus]